MKKLMFLFITAMFFIGCQTVDLNTSTAIKNEGSPEGARNLEEEEKLNEAEIEGLLVNEELKEVDIQKSVIYVERPVYYPLEKAEIQPTGKDAANLSLDKAIQEPKKFSGGTMFYDFDENFVYEIYCQPYRITDLALEPGEMVLENPFLSESQVWEMGAGVSRKNGQDVQHFYLKPDISGLTTSMIIITDHRVYHFLLRSFKDCYMAMVEFEYPNTMPYNIKTDMLTERLNSRSNTFSRIDPRFLSFDYKMSYSIFRKPLWLPRRVYDDGRKTYIQMDEKVLHTQSPVLFNHRNERINYRVEKNLIVIDELIEKVTLRRGKEKVMVKKKNYVEPEPVEESEEEVTEIQEETKKLEGKHGCEGYNLHARFPINEEE
ncbi:MAG: TrbG/VirB9 family P-type conjugative transfer protein [Lachnospiraceae bacterium]|nr:TrbG/VirB9 family P-type conjugative transfer protein [Lachnospiraceae bacterium]